MADSEDRLLTLQEVRARLRISKDLLFREVLPSLSTVYIGTRRLVRDRDLEAWISAHARADGTKARSGR